MEATGSGLRRVRRWKLLLAHDATASTCDPLVDAIDAALGDVDINESSSVDDARLAVTTSRFDVCLVCLDLPPAPQGGVRLAQDMLRSGMPVVLITRSLRWIPPSAAALRELPWVPPDASAGEISRAVGDAIAQVHGPDAATPFADAPVAAFRARTLSDPGLRRAGGE